MTETILTILNNLNLLVPIPCHRPDIPLCVRQVQLYSKLVHMLECSSSQPVLESSRTKLMALYIYLEIREIEREIGPSKQFHLVVYRFNPTFWE